jgi:hypothetical protein
MLTNKPLFVGFGSAQLCEAIAIGAQALLARDFPLGTIFCSIFVSFDTSVHLIHLFLKLLYGELEYSSDLIRLQKMFQCMSL